MPQTTDADRNCISNVRPDGIGYADAVFKLVHLLRRDAQAARVRRRAQRRFRSAGDNESAAT